MQTRSSSENDSEISLDRKRKRQKKRHRKLSKSDSDENSDLAHSESGEDDRFVTHITTRALTSSLLHSE